MRVATARGDAGTNSIRIEDAPVPEPARGEALVRLKAATLNFRDHIIIEGLLQNLAKQPTYIPLSCAAGEVVALGEGVTRVVVGDRVSPIFTQGWIDGPSPGGGKMLGGSIDGVARQYALFPAEDLVRNPDELGDLEAATLPCAGLTAWSALFGARPLQPGEWILAQGTGGVSLAALQWAKAAGGKVVITSSSDAKLARAAAMGADLLVNYRSTPDWAGAVREALGGSKVAIVIDNVGEAELDASASVLGEDGVIAAIGMLGGPFSWTRKEVAGRRIVPIGVGSRTQHEAMLAFAAGHGIRPVVDVVYDLERLPDAYAELRAQRFFGKIGVNLL